MYFHNYTSYSNVLDLAFVQASASEYEQLASTGVQDDAGVLDVAYIESIIDNNPEIGVYVYSSQDTGDTLTAADIAQNASSATGRDIVIVYDASVGRYAVSSDTKDGKIYQALQSVEDGNLGGQIQAGVQEASVVVNYGGSETPNTPNPMADVPVGGLVMATIAVAGIGAIAFQHYKKKKNTSKPTNGTSDNTVKVDDTMPDSIKPLLREMNNLIRKHRAKRDVIQSTLASGGVTGVDVEQLMGNVITNLQELFTRLDKKGATEKKGIAKVEYEDKLKKLIEGLGENYFLDIAQKPEFWDAPTNRLVEVHDAVEGVSLELKQNIKQVNASKDLEFRFVLNALTTPKNSMTYEDIYKEKRGE